MKIYLIVFDELIDKLLRWEMINGTMGLFENHCRI